MEAEVILSLINAGLLVAASVFGGRWVKGKKKLSAAVGVAVTVMDAVEDDHVTPEEEKAIVAKVKALLPSEEE